MNMLLGEKLKKAEQAHKNAVELAKNTEAWKGHEVLIL